MSDLYTRAIEHYGEKHQMGKSIEELNELSKEISRIWLQGHAHPKNVARFLDELADVEIMVKQMRTIAKRHGWEGKLNNRKEFKLNRLDKRIRKEAKNG